MRAAARCLYCDRQVATDQGRYTQHSAIAGVVGSTCPMTGQHTPITGQRPADYVSRAYLVADLAAQVQDEDPTVVWAYLTGLPADELQRLMQIALAAIDCDRSIDELFGWVNALPVARVAS